MATDRTLLIVGAGLAGAKAAEGARSGGFDGRVSLVGDETSPPYDRPPLSKGVLRGHMPLESSRIFPDTFYAEHGIELVTGRTVNSVDLTTHCARFDDGERLAFDSLVLATGAAPRRLAVPGGELDGVYCLRTLADAVALRDTIRASGRLAVVGGSWIGSEVAASAREMGADVVVVHRGPTLLHRSLGPEMGDVFRRLHVRRGVDVRVGTGVAELRGRSQVQEVVLTDGSVVRADVVVVGVGVTPRTELAADAGLAVDDGVVVDGLLRASAPGVYAAGDVARAWHPRYARHMRVEHWANALNQGACAGRNASGARELYDRLPYFYSDQYDLAMEYIGHRVERDELVIRGAVEDRRFIAFWHRAGHVTAAMSINMPDVIENLKALVRTCVDVDRAHLADPLVPLEELVKSTARRGSRH